MLEQGAMEAVVWSTSKGWTQRNRSGGKAKEYTLNGGEKSTPS